MRSWKALVVGWAALIATLSLATVPALALDVQPRDYRLLPAGTDLALAYYDYAHRGSAAIDHGPTYRSGTGLDSHIGILRYVHYTELAGMPVAVQALLPFGGLTNGKIAGSGLENAGGFADPYLSVVIWPYHNAEQGAYFGEFAQAFRLKAPTVSAKPPTRTGSWWVPGPNPEFTL